MDFMDFDSVLDNIEAQETRASNDMGRRDYYTAPVISGYPTLGTTNGRQSFNVVLDELDSFDLGPTSFQSDVSAQSPSLRRSPSPAPVAPPRLNTFTLTTAMDSLPHYDPDGIERDFRESLQGDPLPATVVSTALPPPLPSPSPTLHRRPPNFRYRRPDIIADAIEAEESSGLDEPEPPMVVEALIHSSTEQLHSSDSDESLPFLEAEEAGEEDVTVAADALSSKMAAAVLDDALHLLTPAAEESLGLHSGETSVSEIHATPGDGGPAELGQEAPTLGGFEHRPSPTLAAPPTDSFSPAREVQETDEDPGTEMASEAGHVDEILYSETDPAREALEADDRNPPPYCPNVPQDQPPPVDERCREEPLAVETSSEIPLPVHHQHQKAVVGELSADWNMGASSRPVGFDSPAPLDDMSEEDLEKYLVGVEAAVGAQVRAPSPLPTSETPEPSVPVEGAGISLSRSSSSSSCKRVRFADKVEERDEPHAVPSEPRASSPIKSALKKSPPVSPTPPRAQPLSLAYALAESPTPKPTQEESPSIPLQEHTMSAPDVETPNENSKEQEALPDTPETRDDEPGESAECSQPLGQEEDVEQPADGEEPSTIPSSTGPEAANSGERACEEEEDEGGEYVRLSLPSTEEIVSEGMAGLSADVPPLSEEELLVLERPVRVVPEGEEVTETSTLEPEAEPESSAEPESEEPESVAESSESRPSVVSSTHVFGPTLESFRLTESELQLGKTKPQWIPDADAVTCMLCQAKFSLMNRRHHCRACGRVLCSTCCALKATLPYLQPEAKNEKDAVARVCEPCSTTLQRIKDYEKQTQEAADAQFAMALALEDSNPGAEATQASPVPVPQARGLLRQPDASRSGRRVVFGDGLRPGEAVPPPEPVEAAPAEADSPSSSARRRPPRMPSRRTSRAALSTAAELESFLGGEMMGPPGVDGVGADWPLVVAEGLRHRADPGKLWSQMSDPEAPPVEFAIKRNLTAIIKIVNLECCTGEEVWAVSSVGLRCVAQDEVLVLLKRKEDERRPPFDILRLFNALYEEALQGNRVTEMEHTVVGAISGLYFGPGGFLGSQDHAGLLYIRPSLQCMEGGIPTPDKPFLVGLLLLKSEVPWAKVLPLRLLFRLGAASKVYPCPVVSERGRPVVFEEIGQTIMNLLADFRNYSYSLPWIPGARVQLEDTKTTLWLPKSKLRMMGRIIESSRQAGSVVAWAADFNFAADSHLVAVQQGQAYLTQTINIQGRQRKVTGGSFVVMNGALRAASGVEAKTSIVEDGIMLQVRPDDLDTILAKLKAGEDYSLNIDNAEQQMLFEVKWSEDGSSCKNRGYRSPIDSKKLEGLPCLKVSGKIADHSSGGQLLRMTELFVLSTEIPLERLEELQGELLSLGRTLTAAAAKALLPFASEMAQTGLRTVGIRVTLGPEEVEFSSGAGGQGLPEPLVPGLDSELVPLLYAKAPAQTARLTLELILRILDL